MLCINYLLFHLNYNFFDTIIFIFLFTINYKNKYIFKMGNK